MKIEYPTIEVSKDLSEDKKYDEVSRYYGQDNILGFYPVGRLNAWHGGLHIEGKKLAARAIADGRIIAYRFSTNYCEARDEHDHVYYSYSNNFVLMQHNYESPKGQKFRFYSLYMHLLPFVSPYFLTTDIFPLIAKYTAVVTGDEVKPGVYALSGTKSERAEKGSKVCFIPVGEIVRLTPLSSQPSQSDIYYADANEYDKSVMGPLGNGLDNKPASDLNVIHRKKVLVATKKRQDILNCHWSTHTESLKKYAYKRVFYNETADIYIPTASDYVRDLGNGRLQIIYVNEKEVNPSKIGAVVFDKPNNQGLGKYVDTIQKNDSIQLERINDSWYKVKIRNGLNVRGEEYVCASALNVTISINDGIKLNEVQNVDVQVNAGTVLGYSGCYGFKNNKAYNTVHLEVFTDDTEINHFLTNDPIGDDNRKEYEIQPNVSLKVGTPVNDLRCRDSVVVYQKNENYAQIGFKNIEGITRRDYFKDPTNKNGTYYYTPKENALSQLNSVFENRVTSQSTFVFVSRVDENGNVIEDSDAAEEILKKKAQDEGREFVKYRKLQWEHPLNGHKIWVSSSAVPEETMQEMNSLGLASSSSDATVTTNTEDHENTSDNIDDGSYTGLLTADVDTIYDEEPSSESISIGEKIKVLGIVTKVVDCNNSKWNKIKGVYFDNKIKKIVEAWIQDANLTTINPYIWTNYGWELNEDIEDQYFFKFKEGETVPDFINYIFEKIDTDGNKTITQSELRSAMGNEEIVNKLSKLICKHKSEWDTWNNIDAFTNEVKNIYKDGIDQEEDADEKQRMENVRDERISFMKEKIQNLCFWQDVTEGAVDSLGGLNGKTPPEDKEPRTYPTNNSDVYHFHPLAFIEHMKRIVGFEDIDLSDPDKWVSQWTQPEPETACWATSVLVLKNYGVNGGQKGNKIATKTYENGTFYFSNTIQMVVQTSTGLHGTGREQEGLDYLNEQLENGNPIVVGLDDGCRMETYNSDNTTEHFVVITGRLTDEKGLYYRFFEVGTHNSRKIAIGVSKDNKFRLNDKNILKGDKRTCNPNRTYTVVQIRKNN